MHKLLFALVTPTLAFALAIQGPDEEDRADDQARMEEQLDFYEHFDGEYDAFQEQIAGLSERYDTKKRERFEEANGGSENFIHSWDEDEEEDLS